MKFICEKCKTKYSIADQKVKGKVLKIRCKNCSNVITVREQGKKGTSSGRTKKVGKQTSSGNSGALSRALDGALRGSPRSESGGGGLHLAPVASLDQSRAERATAESEFIEASTQFTAPPDFATLTADAPDDDEWYLAVEGHQFGPMGFSELCSRVKRGEADSEAYLWRDSYEDWRDIATVEELQPFIPKHPPPPPKGKSGLLDLRPPEAVDDKKELPAPVTLPPDGPVPQGPPPASVAPPSSEATNAEVSALAAATMGSQELTPTPMGSMDVNMELTPYGEPIPQAAGAPDPGQLTPAVSPASTGSGVAPLPAPVQESREESKPAAAILAAPVAAPLAAPTTAAVLAAPPTPMVMKLAAVGGIIAAITGMMMVIYFIFIDGPKTPDQVAQPARTVAKLEPVKAPDRVASVNEEEADEVIIEFPAEAIERSETKERIIKKGPSPKTVAKIREPVLTEKQKRLQRLYGGGAGGAKQPAQLPSALPSARKKKKGPSRRISASEIGNLQKRNKKGLKACYERALKRDNTLVEIKAEIEVTIGNSGMVKRVKVGNVDSMELKVCLTRVVKRWNFPSAGEQTIAFPIIFRGS